MSGRKETASEKYWREREEEQLKHNITDERAYKKELRKIYEDMLENSQKEIDRFYRQYADAEGITLSEAKKRVSQLEIERYAKKAKRYCADKNFTKEANEEMRLYNATMKINRLEMLKANIGLELVDGHDKLQKFMCKILTGHTEAELRRQAGILGNTIHNNAKLANSIVNASFHNATFSTRIWGNQTLMKADLEKLLQSGLIRGKSAKELAKDLRKYYIGDEYLKNGKNGAVYRTETLMITELRRVQTAAAKRSYEENGIEYYTFLAVNPEINSEICSSCKAIDGKHFKVSEMQVGLNAPPMHPRCHCTTAPYRDEKEFYEWLDFLDKGGSTEEWKKAKGKLANSHSSNIIKEGNTISGGRNPYKKNAQNHAVRYYGLVRSMTTDVSKIAKSSGESEEDIQSIKNYIFYEKHDLGGENPERFTPDYMMAESWKRLMNGNPEKHDLTLLKHEKLERDLISQGMNQQEAHAKASEKYNYSKEAEEYYDKIKKYND